MSGSPPDAISGAAVPEVVAAAAQHNGGQLRYVDADRAAMVAAYTHSALSGWTVAVSAPVADIEATARRAVHAVFFGVAAMLACALAVASLFGRRLVESLTRATRAAA